MDLPPPNFHHEVPALIAKAPLVPTMSIEKLLQIRNNYDYVNALLDQWLDTDPSLFFQKSGRNLQRKLINNAVTLVPLLYGRLGIKVSLLIIDKLETIKSKINLIKLSQNDGEPKEYFKSLFLLDKLARKITFLIKSDDTIKYIISDAIPWLCQENDLDSLKIIAKYFPSNLQISDTCMIEVAAHINANNDELCATLAKLNLESPNYPSLNTAFMKISEPASSPIYSKIMAFLTYPESAPKDEGERSLIIQALRERKNAPKTIKVKLSLFLNVVKQAVLREDASFIVAATNAQMVSHSLDKSPAAMACYLCHTKAFWTAFIKAAKEHPLSLQELNKLAHSAALEHNANALAAALMLGADVFALDPHGADIEMALGKNAPRECVLAVLQHSAAKDYRRIAGTKMVVDSIFEAIGIGDAPLLEAIAGLGFRYMTECEKTFEKEMQRLMERQNTRAILALHKLNYHVKNKPHTNILSCALKKVYEDPYISDELLPALIMNGANAFEKTPDGPCFMDFILESCREDLWRLVREQQYDQDQLCYKEENRKHANIYNNSPLLREVHKGNLAAVNLLLAHGLEDVNQKAPDQKTALHWSVQSGNYQMAKALLEAGIDHRLQDQNGHDAYDWAQFLGRTEMAKLILGFRG